MTEYEFDVAPSFAEEDRQAEMWGLDLVEYFSETFNRRARFVLLFSSQHYVSAWAGLQRRAAQARALEQHTEYLLPIRIDDTPVPGLLQTIAYLDTRRHDDEVIAQAVVQKLAQHRASFTPTTPITPQSVAALVREKPRGWEYLLYVTVVSQGLAELESKYWEHFLRYAPRNGSVEHGNGIDLIRDRNVLLSEIIKIAVEAVFTGETQEAAFGRPGEVRRPAATSDARGGERPARRGGHVGGAVDRRRADRHDGAVGVRGGSRSGAGVQDRAGEAVAVSGLEAAYMAAYEKLSR